MLSKVAAIALMLSAATASPTFRARQDDKCVTAYDACVAAGTAEVICSCDRTACYGEDAARIREWCSSQIAALPKSTSAVTPVASSIPGGCNPAHPGSCPSSYFDTTTAAPAATFTSISGIPGGCNPAHPGSCPSSYFDTTTKSPAATFTSIPGIPGGCNPAHPGSCPTPSVVASPVATAAPGSNPKLVEGKTWTISNLTRYCIEGNSGCDYNFAVTADGKTERCTVIRMPGSNAASESWANQPCTTGSDLTISWGYVAQPAPAFAVITVNKGAELAWFGVSDINGGKVSPSSPFGSGDFGTLPASPVYTYN
ncbi:hypothetical protein AA0118_g6469 [Alternaria tenuissima]|nr:hypothetical protein AA0118_g6469 [Alternaria tenuissima]